MEFLIFYHCEPVIGIYQDISYQTLVMCSGLFTADSSTVSKYKTLFINVLLKRLSQIFKKMSVLHIEWSEYQSEIQSHQNQIPKAHLSNAPNLFCINCTEFRMPPIDFLSCIFISKLHPLINVSSSSSVICVQLKTGRVLY